LHGAFLTFKGEKVSKSKGGLYTISELQELGYKPLDYRFMCLLTHYRSSLDFTLDNLNAAKNGLEGLKNKIANISSNAPGGDGEKYLKEFEKSINDDLNMPGAIQALQKLLKDDKVSGKSKIELVRKMDAVFSLDLMKKERVIVPEEVQKLAEQRWQAKKTKNFKLADELRAKVTAMGFVIADMPEGYEIKKA